MKIFNTSGYEVEGMANGVFFKLDPFEERDVYPDEHGTHLCKSLAHKGVVHLNFSDSLQSKYKTYDAFKNAQTLNGLQSLRKTIHEAYINERQAIADLKQQRGSEYERELMNPDKFKNMLEEIDGWIAEAKAEAKEEQPKKRGRQKMSGSRHDQNQSAAQA